MSSPSILQSMPVRVFNPSSLAVFTSIGVHALVLGIALPSFFKLSSAESATERRTIGVVELNPAEQTRLPDLSQSSFDLPNVTNTPLLNTPLEESPSSLAPQSSLPNSLNTLPPPPYSSYPYPSSLPPLGINNNLPIASPPRSYSYVPPPPYGALTPPPPNAPNLPGLPREMQRPNFEPPRAAIDPYALINQKPNPSLLNQGERFSANPQPGASNNFNQNQAPISLDEDARRQLIAKRLVMDSLRRGQENLSYNPSNTTDEEARKNDLAWMAQSGQTLSKNQVIAIAGKYPQEACQLRIPARTAIYNVSVNGQGKMIQPPSLIKSAGYPILNQQALQQVQSLKLANSTRVNVNFKYDPQVCASVPVPARETLQSPNLAPSTPGASPALNLIPGKRPAVPSAPTPPQIPSARTLTPKPIATPALPATPSPTQVPPGQNLIPKMKPTVPVSPPSSTLPQMSPGKTLPQQPLSSPTLPSVPSPTQMSPGQGLIPQTPTAPVSLPLSPQILPKKLPQPPSTTPALIKPEVSPSTPILPKKVPELLTPLSPSSPSQPVTSP